MESFSIQIDQILSQRACDVEQIPPIGCVIAIPVRTFRKNNCCDVAVGASVDYSLRLVKLKTAWLYIVCSSAEPNVHLRSHTSSSVCCFSTGGPLLAFGGKR